MEYCPRCKRKTLNPDKAMNSLSRRDSETYICNACGEDESEIDSGFQWPAEVEKEFIKTHKRRK